eukprot:TRINITY_DN2892_c0_g1_i1.p1 TRINITY_DN2892_c0_g1~~TRINITY_DN2892_c0_g1_i1.p1  ORF type:complete len:520 (-),score=68.29 TRINITY_DN2892_c0_g1_i1:5-1564(-)
MDDGENAAATAGTHSSSLEQIMSPQALESVRSVEALEAQPWYAGLAVTAQPDPSCPEVPGSMSKPRHGRTKGYDSDNQNFLVLFENSTEVHSVPSHQLNFDFEDVAELACETECSQKLEGGDAELIDRVKPFFAPGSKFEGTIAIPGMGQVGGRQTYTLEIIAVCKDELGDRCLLARHSAYGDEQSCNVTFRICHPSDDATGSAAVQVCYSDGETQCKGVVSIPSDGMDAITVRGCVVQFLQGEEGFLEPSEDVTHFFELKRVTVCAAQAAHARRTGSAQRNRLEELCLWLQSSTTLSRDDSLVLQSCIPWRDIVFRDMMRLCEEQCAVFRRQSAVLNGLRFASRSDKEETLSKLQQASLTRHAGHEAMNNIILRLKTLCGAALPAMRQDLLSLDTACMQATSRLYRSYCQLDKALRSAENRLPRDLLDSWVLVGENVNDTPCAVCFLPLVPPEQNETLGEETTLVKFPCSHCFHMECVAQWLHGQTTCPTCRYELSGKNLSSGDGDTLGTAVRLAGNC